MQKHLRVLSTLPHDWYKVRNGSHRRCPLIQFQIVKDCTCVRNAKVSSLVYILVQSLLVMTEQLTKAAQGRDSWPHRLAGYSASWWGHHGNRNMRKLVTVFAARRQGHEYWRWAHFSLYVQFATSAPRMVMPTLTLHLPNSLKTSRKHTQTRPEVCFPGDGKNWQWRWTLRVEILASQLWSLDLLPTR